MKRIFVLIICFILILSITGCGKENDHDKMISYLKSIGYKCENDETCTLNTDKGYSYSMVIPSNSISIENAHLDRIYDNGDKIEIFVAAYSIENLSAIYTKNNGKKYKLYDENSKIFKKKKYVLCDHYEGKEKDECDLIWLDVNETKEMLEDIFSKAKIDLNNL